ncbi:MFS transporter [Paraburkholderia sp. UYCP14C]|uniref:MFS transporter n=1 Tax=Paraburkholderia sp. UYCP14C TaxID=2511130 RepID=UPI00102279C3|nr:MFS transporter [Paraburkholderia sp. UYCP14C]RZF31381.1 MFS transporter [Paraburkholderia sp. UYCP14C]
MPPFHALFVLLGTLLAASGYGATFLLSMHFRSVGGTDLNTGVAFAQAVIGTFVSFPLVDWFAPRVGAARLTAIGALCLGAGVAAFTVVAPENAIGFVPGFLVGFGWGSFSLAAPMALAERTTNTDRGSWLMRFGTIQMLGIGACPALAAFAIRSLHWTVATVLLVVAGLCMIASLMLEVFARLSPNPATHLQRPWALSSGAILRTRAVYSIAMIGLCACVFSGLLTFQMALVQGTGSSAGTFFSVYTVTVVVARWLLGRLVIISPREITTKLVLLLMLLGVAAMFAVPYHTLFHPTSAVLFGAGYGLAYPVIQEQAVNDSDSIYRHAALTWFIVAYSLGAFGFPAVGGWVLVHVGRSALIALIAMCGTSALALSVLRDKRHLTTKIGS